jgi:multidrug resistance efflux pump
MLYDEGAVSRQELDTVLTQRQVAQQKLDAKTAALEAAKQQLQDTTIDLQAEADSRAAAIRADPPR